MKKILATILVLCMALSLCAVPAFAAEGVGGTEYPNPLQDVRVRQALWYAIDIDSIVDALWEGSVVATHSTQVPEGFWRAEGLKEYTYDPDMARQLLDEAGWDGSYTIRAVYYTTNLLDTITAIQSYWKDVGVNMEFQLLTDNLTELLWTPSADGVHSSVDWDICFAGNNAMTLGQLYGPYYSTANQNSYAKPDPELDALIDASKLAITTEDQKAAFDALQVYENEHVMAIPLFFIPSWIVTSDLLDMAGDPVGNDQYTYRKNILDWTIDREDHTMYTDNGAINALWHPAINPGLYWHEELVFDRLLFADENLTPTDGDLAETYEVSEDGTVFTFHLRDGVTWHDGEPFTADDVKWTFEYYNIVPGTNSVLTDVINDAKAITVDGNTVTFEFNNPQPNALLVFSQWPILPKHCLEDVAPEDFASNTFWQAPIGTGSFKVEEVKLGEYTTLVRNEDYYRTGTGNIERIYMYPSEDAGDENLVTNAQAGQIDYAFCKDATQIKQLEELDNYTVQQVDVTFPRYICLNTFDPAE